MIFDVVTISNLPFSIACNLAVNFNLKVRFHFIRLQTPPIEIRRCYVDAGYDFYM